MSGARFARPRADNFPYKLSMQRFPAISPRIHHNPRVIDQRPNLTSHDLKTTSGIARPK